MGAFVLGRKKNISFFTFCLAAKASIVFSACVGMHGEFSQRTSLFGNGSRSSRALPTPPQSQQQQLAARPQFNSENLPLSGSIMPQLSGAMAGNSSSGGFVQPMVNSPLMFQRLDKNTWRVATNATHLFQTLARVLSQGYIISKADRQSLSLSTEWDKFFIDGRLFRNRISINIFPFNQRSADLILKNNIEYYTQTAQKIDESDPTQWLPTQDVTDELDKILEKTQKQLIASLSGGATR